MKLENHLKILAYNKLRRAITDEYKRLQKQFDETPASYLMRRASLAARIQLLTNLNSIEYRVADEE